MSESKGNTNPKRWAGVLVEGVLYGPSWEDYVASLTPPPNKAISGLTPISSQDLLQSEQT